MEKQTESQGEIGEGPGEVRKKKEETALTGERQGWNSQDEPLEKSLETSYGDPPVKQIWSGHDKTGGGRKETKKITKKRGAQGVQRSKKKRRHFFPESIRKDSHNQPTERMQGLL